MSPVTQNVESIAGGKLKLADMNTYSNVERALLRRNTGRETVSPPAAAASRVYAASLQ